MSNGLMTLLAAIATGSCVFLAAGQPAIGPLPRRPSVGQGSAVETRGISEHLLARFSAFVFGRRADRRRRDQQNVQIVPVVEVISVVIGSGGTVSEALRLLAGVGPASVRPEMEVAAQSRASGLSLPLTLERLTESLSDRYRPVLTVIAAAERDGAPLSLVLARLADEAATARRLRAEERARRLPVQMLFPLVACFLPAVVIGAVIPLVAVSIGSFF